MTTNSTAGALRFPKKAEYVGGDKMAVLYSDLQRRENKIAKIISM
jgi:hypothetical protein